MSTSNLYDEGVDFRQLAAQSPAFQHFLQPNGQLNFGNPAAVKQLAISLLERDFRLTLELPDDRLCPAVPNRWTYVRWVQDLIDSTDTSGDFTDAFDSERHVTGLDIGTGASCIYPLLACAMRPRWRFVATELDDKNFDAAKHNVRGNELADRIRPIHTTTHDPLIPLDKLGLERIDFTMCNPPFYSSASDMLESAAAKSRPPRSTCTGAEIEMVTPGGEVAFVNRMVQESKALLDRVQWYTSMLGKLSSVETILESLRAQGVKNWAVQEFVQGEKTRRWGVAWSWLGARPTVAVARGIGSIPKEMLPFPSEQSINIPGAHTDAAVERASKVLSDLDLRWEYRHALHQGIGSASKNVWSRAARRERQREVAAGSKKVTDGSDEDEPALSFKLSFTGNDTDTLVQVRWLQGQDTVLFESFCGMLRRTLVSPK